LLGLSRYALGDGDGATVELKEALRLQPTLFSAELDSGLHAMERGDWVSAQKSFYRLVEAEPHHADALCLLGAACLERDRPADAKRYLAEALKVNVGYIEAKKRLALVHYREGDYAEAERLITEAIELHQDYPDLYKILGDIRNKRGEFQAAKEAYKESLALNPDYANAVFGMVIAMRRDGNGHEADEMLRDFIRLHPSNLMARTLLTVEKMKMSDT
ncbi:MAG: tetratricopeptide repeat protein, partial [Candidatus Krumholzibacteria bacterium]|nr:tetratricopeptide repeat protein [Candidatus Krumholzibacteria bacterium]